MLILAGTTAVGKTEVSIPLAELLKGEIISADSRQVYQELVIGTAKPTPEQRTRAPHHFVDDKSVRERWTAGDFGREARMRIDAILERGHLPVIVGGSMLYLRSLIDGFYEDDEEPPWDYSALREELKERGETLLYHELEHCDPELARRTNPQDHHRILRGLAVFRQRGIRLSELQRTDTQALAYPFRLYFLHADREQTYQRVNARVIDMVSAGLIDEVRQLYDLGLDESNCNALRTHGYQEVFPYLRGEVSREQMIENIQKAVRHYVKRQVTWFRHDARVVWIERSYDEPAGDVAERIVLDFLA